MKKELEKRIYSSLILIPITLFFIIQGSVFLIFFLSLFFLATSYEWLKMNKKNDLMKLIGIIFLFFSFYSAFYIRQNLGLDFFLFIILVCIFTDIGGYVFGKTFKGPKLTVISPNKTYAGVIGGFLFALIAGLSHMKYIDSKFLFLDPINVIIGILLISLISQVGDLIISYFKRKAKLKNTGKILPGHGGLLDRVDGLILVMPIIYLKIFII
jgi:phosphatidate cytidylyltransferase